MALLSGVRHVFLDMDGTIYHGSQLYPTTIPFLDFLSSHGIGHAFITNNSSRSRQEYVSRLERFGIHSTEENFYTSVEFCMEYLQTHHPDFHRLYWLGCEHLKPVFSAAGFQVVEDDPDVVIVGFDVTLTYEKLCRAAWFIHQGKPVFATHPDVFCPSDQPTWLVDCGAITAALEVSTGMSIPRLGKPHADMLRCAARHYGVTPEQCIMIGDRLSTDIASGVNSGCLTCQITGPGADRTMVEGVKADWEFDNLGELQQLWESSLS